MISLKLKKIFDQSLGYYLAEELIDYLLDLQREKINQEYHKMYYDRFDDGRVWLRLCYLLPNNQEEGNHHNNCGLLSFTFRYLGNPSNKISISHLEPQSESQYLMVNYDFYAINRETELVTEYIRYQLPKRYFFSSGLNWLRGFKDFAEDQLPYNNPDHRLP